VSIYAVNGKEPIGAWIESLDPESVTSSVATDLVGSNHGTLTNMDLTADPDTARKADTDAGGTRALDLDGSNDFVNFGTGLNASLLGEMSISGWWKLRNRSSVNGIMGNGAAGGSGGFAFEVGRTANKLSWLQNSSTIDATSTGTITDSNWHHIVVVRTGSTGAWTITI